MTSQPIFTLSQIAAALGAQVLGDGSLPITNAAEPHSAGPQDLALAMDEKYAGGIAQGRAVAALLWQGADWQVLGLKGAIYAPRGRLAMAGLSKMLDHGPDIAAGVHPSCVVAAGAQIGTGAAIGPFVTIGAGASIGARARIAGHVSIGAGAQIGDDALILEGARIGARVVLGARVIVQMGAVIGADGLSFVTPQKSGVEEIRETLGHRGDIVPQAWTRIHSLGSVSIGDDVEIGANCAIDRGTIRATTIGRGTKLDNLVHIAHNVQIGQDCMICGQVGIAGSARIGNRVVLAGQCGVNDNIFIGDDVICGGATKVFTNVPSGRVMLGYPAVKMDSHIEMQKALRRLPRMLAKLVNPQGNT